GLVASSLCSQAGLARSDIYDSKYVPSKVDDSLVGGNSTLVTVDGQQVIAGPKTPSEFTTSEKGGFALNPEFLERMGYNRLGDLSVLIPRRNPEAWRKISFKGSSIAAGEIDGDSGKAPPAPGSLQASNTTVSWGAATGHLIVG